MSVVYLDRKEFIARSFRYAGDAAASVELAQRLQQQADKYQPDGWVLLECHVLDSSSLGQLAILPFGPNNTLKVVPDGPVSPRGSASDMSVVVAVCLVESKVERVA